ncbi:MAG: SDR family NAD(P)-dependent oxidoreductase [Candidatus Eremiobacteraeota bacterium]|nr:SDR family NAD(P)-dependent oxidoreductase [Candidatus Eremiobacteraeota bacterium]MBC5827452.1 SDR family NAD(P)-dependent oxidoreductase [Candidatus Eremiobacteraeota bacterium]
MDDKVAVVTGANRGIGLAISTLFARAGARCVMVARHASGAEDAAKLLRSEGLEAEVDAADVTSCESVRRLADSVKRRHGWVDVLVNNAGVFLDEDRRMSPDAVDLGVVQRTLDVNLYGAMRMATAFAPFIRAGGRIINVSSTMGQLSDGSDGYGPAYSISKAALNAYTQSLAAVLQKREVMVDCFHPGWAKTDMGGPRATVDPMESAATALFLATRPASDRTGLFWRGRDPIAW